MSGHYTGWLLPDDERARLLDLFPPSFPEVIAHHITYQFGVGADTELPTATAGRIIGRASDALRVEALVVEIEGTSARPDGSALHCTWSLDRDLGGRPVLSNAVIRDRGYKLHEPVDIRLVPTLFSTGSGADIILLQTGAVGFVRRKLCYILL